MLNLFQHLCGYRKEIPKQVRDNGYNIGMTRDYSEMIQAFRPLISGSIKTQLELKGENPDSML